MTNLITLSHGAGGKEFDKILNNIFFEEFSNPFLLAKGDGAILPPTKGRLVMSTDSHVVSPLFFPGGNIGTLAFCGTVNDIAMMGAQPLYLSMGFIIEEGLPITKLKEVVSSIGELSRQWKIPVVTGDTKVVERGKADEIFITTAGIGVIKEDEIDIKPNNVSTNDVIITSGPLGNHGATLMASREHFKVSSELRSDCSPVHHIIQSLLSLTPKIHCLRDPTRGGLAAVLNEICHDSNVSLEIEEELVPVEKNVVALCELLGLDPLQLASEGRFILFCPQEEAQNILGLLKSLPECREAQIIGKAVPNVGNKGMVSCITKIGGNKLVPWPSGEQFPRIC